ncbi:MAG: TonB-dependent receptor [Bacteroidales bacterium]|nr:TonB-dependent receptor [Bacteroidales bacterium]
MHKRNLLSIAVLCACTLTSYAQEKKDTLSRNIDEVVVTATLSEVNLKNVPMTVSIVNSATIEQSEENNLLPIVAKQVPGLYITQRGMAGFGVSTGAAGGISIRGIGSSPTTGMLVLVDGNPQYMGLMGHPLPDAYESNSTERVEVVRGPASILYGSNAMGGVMNIITKRQKEDGSVTRARMAYGSYNTFQTQFSNGYKKGKFNSFASFSSEQTDGHRTNSEFKQYAGYLRLGYDISDIWKISGESNVTGFWASNPGTVSAPMIDNDARILRGVASIAIQNNYEKTSGAIKAFYNFGQHNINDGYLDSTGVDMTGKKKADYMPLNTRFRSKDYMAGISAYQSYRFFNGNTTTAGVDYKNYGGRAWTRNLEPGKADIKTVDKTINEIAGYINIQQSFSEILTLNAGVRYDYNDYTGGEWVPQGGISVAASPTTILKAVIGKGFRNPTIREMYMFPPQNPDLKPEKLINYEISVSQSFLEKALTFDVSLFYIDGNNLIQLVPTPTGTIPPFRYQNSGEIKNCGVEFAGNYRVNRYLSLMLNYSFLHMENPVLAAPQHNLIGSGQYSRAGWTVYTSLQYVNGLYTALASQTFPAQTENYVMWDVTAGYRFNKWLEGFVKGENLLNQTYEINAGYPMPGATVMAGINIKI